MLVLTRKPQETIRIGDHITISILRVKGRAVRVGIEAPDNVRVVRGELTAQGDASPSDRRPARGKDQDSAADKEEGNGESFLPQPKLSTQCVNRILASRRRGPLSERVALATAQSASWHEPSHLPLG